MRRSKSRITVYFTVIICLTIFCSNISAAARSDNKLLEKGIYQFRQENYDEALATFTQVTKEEPESSLAAYYLGLTYKRIEDFASAKKHLIVSLKMTPKIKNALIELIDTLYRLRDYDEAKKFIRLAEKGEILPAQAKLLKGLTLQKTGEFEDSITAFEEAKNLDEKLSQTANYQIGISHLRMKNYKSAKDAFEQVFALDPYSDFGEYADTYINSLDRKLDKDKPFHMMVRYAFEYDTNVISKPEDVSLVRGISEEKDTRQLFDLKADYTIRSENNFLSLKTGYWGRVSKQNTIGSHDTIRNNFSAQGNMSFKKVLVTFPVNYTHSILNDKNYLSSFSAGNLNNIMVSRSQMAQLGITYSNNNYLRPVSVPSDNRDADVLAGTAAWFWFFAGNQGFINLQYKINKNWAKGSNWDNLGNSISSGLLYPFGDKFKLSLNGAASFKGYDSTNTIYDTKRQDQTYTAGSFLSYELIKNLELQLRYTYTNTQSNISVYQYDRHVVSSGLQYRY